MGIFFVLAKGTYMTKLLFFALELIVHCKRHLILFSLRSTLAPTCASTQKSLLSMSHQDLEAFHYSTLSLKIAGQALTLWRPHNRYYLPAAIYCASFADPYSGLLCSVIFEGFHTLAILSSYHSLYIILHSICIHNNTILRINSELVQLLLDIKHLLLPRLQIVSTCSVVRVLGEKVVETLRRVLFPEIEFINQIALQAICQRLIERKLDC